LLFPRSIGTFSFSKCDRLVAVEFLAAWIWPDQFFAKGIQQRCSISDVVCHGVYTPESNLSFLPNNRACVRTPSVPAASELRRKAAASRTCQSCHSSEATPKST